MYESFFGFDERPFASVPLVERYFPATGVETARQTLTRCLERAEGTALLTGPAGTGKSMLCQVIASQFQDCIKVALLASGHLSTRAALLQAILYELGLPYRGMQEGDLRLSLLDHLSPHSTADERAANGLLLIIDEAHTLPLRLLEELRLITNFVRQNQPQVRLLLAGGPQLEERFASPKLASFNQRIAARCYLESLDRPQTAEYVQHEIQQVGGNPDNVFTADALGAVFNATDGIPRLVNQVCDHALLLAYAGGMRTLSASGIEEAWADLQQLPSPWNASQTMAASPAAKGVIEFGNLDEETSDDMPAAVPFRAAASAGASKKPNPMDQIEAIEKQLFEMDDDFQPVGSIRPEVELVFQSTSNPFEQSFDEEEVVIDRYTAIEADALANRPLVTSAEGHELSALLAPFTGPGKPSVAIAAATWPGGTPQSAPPAESHSAAPGPTHSAVASQKFAMQAAGTSSVQADRLQSASKAATAISDEDLIVIEDPPEQIVTVTKKAAPRVKRQEYRQLFAQLRRG